MSDAPRYLPDLPWPPYAYRPGQGAHPTRDSGGHSFGQAEDLTPAEPPEDFARSGRYLRGVDLFNYGFGWEAHEVWESLWHRPADSTQAAWLQALIQLAAAAVQESVGHADGRARLCRRALDHLQRVHDQLPTVYMGLEVATLRAAIEDYAADQGRRPVLLLQLSQS